MGIYYHPPPPMMGGSQPHAPRELTPSISAVPVNDPPYSHAARLAIFAALVSAWQPDPWTYNFAGGRQPFARLTMSPGIPGLDVDTPPFSHAGRQPVTAELVATWQPDLWTYNYPGGWQPFTPRKINPGVPSVSLDPPPFAHRERAAALTNEIAATAQPNPWTYTFAGGWQPFQPGRINASISAVPVNDPPYMHAGRSPTLALTLAMTQPDPWVFLYHGERQPFMPRKANPGWPGMSADAPPFSHRERILPVLAELAAIAQPDPWTYNFAGNRQPFMSRRLPPGMPGVSVDTPPLSHRGRAAVTAELVAVWQPDPWVYAFAGGRQPFMPRQLPPVVMNVTVSTVPFSHPGRSVTIAEIIASVQPNPWTYTYAGGPQPFSQRELARNFLPYSIATIIG